MAGKADLIVSVSGIRGIVGQGLTPEAAAAFAAALASTTNGGKIVVSRDGRPSGVMLRHAVIAGLLCTGCEVHDLGILPTPTCGYAIRRLKAAGGIQITASHNPAPWNGLKLFGADGAVLPALEGQKIKERFEAGQFNRVAWQDVGRLIETHDAEDWHRERVLELLDVPGIRGAHLKTFLDANGGAGGKLGRDLLNALQTQPIFQACDTDGIFLHEPEPTAENLGAVCPRVPQHAADIGFVLDPDADRLAVIDESGRYIGEELTLALALSYRLRQQRGPVVVNMSTSRVNQDIAGQHGCPFHRAAVGEANVVEKMRAVGAVIGGEGNGGVIDPRVGWVRDPFIGMGLILNLMAATGKKLSELVGELPTYAIVKNKYTVDRGRLPELYECLVRRWPEAKADRLDGLRLDWDDRWLHVRPSNTEPIIRVIAEAPNALSAGNLCNEVGGLIVV